MPKATPPAPADPSPDYKNLIDLLAVLGEAETRLSEMQARLDEDQRNLVDEVRDEYVELQTKIADAEQAIETICRRHPEWFKKAKTVKTLYGSAAARETKKLIIPDEPVTITLIQAAGRGADFIRVTTEVDREALEKLDDAELAKFGVTRSVDTSYTIKPAKLDLGKAVQDSEARGDAKAA